MKHLPSKDWSAQPIEYRNDDDAPADLAGAIAAVTELRNASTAFEARLTEQLAEITARLDEDEARSQRPGNRQGGDDTEAEHRALSHFLRAGARELDDTERRALNLTTPSAGGYAVAPTYSTTIIEGITELSPMRSLANVVQIGTTELWLPKLVTELDGGWVSETGSRAESQPVFGQQKIETHEHAVIVPISTQLLEDSFVDLPAYLSGQIARRFARAESIAFTSGSGSGQPTGFLHSPDDFEQVDTAQAGGNPTVAQAIGKVVDLFYSLPSEYAARGTWQMNRRTMGLLRRLSGDANSGAGFGYIWADSLRDGTPATLLGRPVVENPHMDDWSDGGESPSFDTFPVAFGDWSAGYTIVDRVNVEIMSDPYTGADTGVTKLRARRRVGGEVTLAEAIVLLRAG